MNKQKLLKEKATSAKPNKTSPNVANAKDKTTFEKGENEK